MIQLLQRAVVSASLVGCALAQYDADVAEPIRAPRGTLLLGAPEPPAAVLRIFLRSGDGPLVVIDPPGGGAGEPPAAAAWWKKTERFAARERAHAESALWTALLARAGAVWVRDGDAEALRAAWAGTPLAAGLAGVLQRGGAVAFEGACAAACGEIVIVDGADVPAPGLGLLPGAVVTLERSAATRALRVRPDLVAVELGADATVIVQGRRIVGVGGARSRLAAGPLRTALATELTAGRPLDLLALSRAARVRAGDAFPAPELPGPEVPAGALMLGGGGRLSGAALARFIELAGGPDAPLVVVPCTAAETLTGAPGDVAMLRRAGARNVTWVHTKDRARADTDEALLGPLRAARGVWFGGGRQWNLVDSYQHTEAHRLMHAVLERGGVIGGSSAGASIQAAYLCRGDPLGNTNIIAEGYETGLGFLAGVGVDQHFSQRGRQPDMEELVTTYPQLLGVGLDEGVMLVVQGSVGTAIGGKAWFYDAARAEDGRQRPVTLDDGQRYDLARRAKLD